ncbi:degenerin del-1 isoform X2 [Nematostella vectensis]|nr:degenerin del-1 isoform X2 [Nematostella vectensis]
MRNKLMSMVMGMNATTRTELGHQEKDFIFGCYWLGQPCNTSFEQIFTPEYGNCFTFNSGKLHDLAVTEAGDTEGLSLLLNTEQWDYMGAVSPSIGAIVDVHHPDDIEVPAVRGITVSPGQATSIGLVLGSMYRLDSPYSKTGCKSIDTPTIYKNKIYSAEACYRGCLIAKSLEKCGCVESRMQVGLTAQTCDPFNKTLRKCIEEVVDFNSCSCPPACREMKFEFSASTSVWPSEPYWTFLKEAYDSRNTSRSFASFPDSRGNLLAVNIFFKDMSITIKTETFSYEFSNLVADVGGQLGLFVGMSVLSIMEYWELLIDLGTALLRRDKTLRVAVASKPET